MKNYTLVISLLLLSSFAYGKEGVFSTSKGALRGYDPVSYLDDEKAVEGSDSFTHVHEGATFKFSSEEHKNLFVKNPDKYLPAYGGHCAWALADSGKIVDSHAHSFLVIKGEDGKKRTYLFYDRFFADTRKYWIKKANAEGPENKEKQELGMISTANKAWDKL